MIDKSFDFEMGVTFGC